MCRSTWIDRRKWHILSYMPKHSLLSTIIHLLRIALVTRIPLLTMISWCLQVSQVAEALLPRAKRNAYRSSLGWGHRSPMRLTRMYLRPSITPRLKQKHTILSGVVCKSPHQAGSLFITTRKAHRETFNTARSLQSSPRKQRCFNRAHFLLSSMCLMGITDVTLFMDRLALARPTPWVFSIRLVMTPRE